MKLSDVPNFRIEDFASEKAWIGTLFSILNPFIQSLAQILDQNVDFATNLQSVSQSYTIQGFAQFSIKWPFQSSPGDVRITYATKGSSPVPTILIPAWSYDPGTQAITISRISELTASAATDLAASLTDPYTFTVRATI